MKKFTTVLLVLFCCVYTQTSTAQASDKLFKSCGYNIQWTKLPIAASSFGGQITYDNLTQRGIGYELDIPESESPFAFTITLGTKKIIGY